MASLISALEETSVGAPKSATIATDEKQDSGVISHSTANASISGHPAAVIAQLEMMRDDAQTLVARWAAHPAPDKDLCTEVIRTQRDIVQKGEILGGDIGSIRGVIDQAKAYIETAYAILDTRLVEDLKEEIRPWIEVYMSLGSAGVQDLTALDKAKLSLAIWKEIEAIAQRYRNENVKNSFPLYPGLEAELMRVEHEYSITTHALSAIIGEIQDGRTINTYLALVALQDQARRDGMSFDTLLETALAKTDCPFSAKEAYALRGWLPVGQVVTKMVS